MLPEIEEAPYEDIDPYLPNIYAQDDGKSRNFRHKRNTSPGRKKDTENLFIYKDFDTSLTKVKVPVSKLARLD